MLCWNCEGKQSDERLAFCTACTDLGGNPTPLRFERYIVQRYLGHGTFGAVYKCWDPLFDRLVAVKKLQLPWSGAIDAVNEIRAGGRLDHANIVRFYDADQDRGIIIMEYVGGGSLQDRLEADPDWVRANFTNFFMELCEGLRAAHAERLLHRDIKPANILITDSGHPKIADFGVARILQTNEFALTHAGSPAYMAPEVLYGDEYGLDADIHSLGCVMYQVWAGHLPFIKPGNAIALALQKQQADFVPLRAENPEVDDILNELVKGMLAPAAQRISSVEVVLEQLRHRDPSIALGGVASIDELQFRVGAIYGLRNRSRSPLLLLDHFHVSITEVTSAYGRTDDEEYYRKRVEAFLPRAFAWLCALASSVNARLSQLIWLKFDGQCPYCDGEECQCPSLDRRRSPERNLQLLEKLHDRRLIQASAPKTFAQYQALFRRIYGQVNQDAGSVRVGLHAHSEVAEATDALLHLTSLRNAEQVTVLHLELSDLVAWFFALLNLYRSDYSFVDGFDKLFADGCYVCRKESCECTSVESELRLVNWREF